MGLAELLTKLFEPCRSAPKSPPCPTSPENKSKAEKRAAANASDKTIVEVLPCGEITNTSDQPSPKPTTHADGFAVNQVKMPEQKQQKCLEEDTDSSKLIVDAFGFEVHRLLTSKAWDDRAQAIAAAKEICARGELPSNMEESVFVEACCKLVMTTLQDKVMPIYFDGLELIKFLFGEMFEKMSSSKEVINASLEELLPTIIAKIADRNARSNEGTRSILTFLARCSLVGCSPVMAHIFTPITNSKEVSAIRGRLELIDHVIAEFGFGKSSTITMQLVMGFVRPHLDATDEKVRRAAIEVTVTCYKHKGDRTLKYITNVKPALLKLLQSRFAECDKPARSSRKNAKSALPEVRGKPRKSRPPLRESASQPCGKTNPESFFQNSTIPEDNNTNELSNVLRDCPQLFSMGSSTMVVSPLSGEAPREVPMEASMGSVMPGAVPPTGFEDGLGMEAGFEDDLDADLMDEIEAY